MKIGLWGSYDKGNFGDDLMAYMISSYLTGLDMEVILFSPTPELVSECSCDSTNDIEKFVKSCDYVVIGGGGMLINNSILRFFAKRVAFDFEVSFFKLLRAVVKYNRKLICISIGGDGENYLNNPFKRKLFENPICLGGSVRLESDLNTVDSNLFSYIPDIVLQTPIFFKSDNSLNNTGKKRIVLNLKSGSEKFLERFISDYRDSLDIITFGSHLPSSGNNYELISKENHFVFKKLKESVEFLSRADLIISSKLHVGVTGLSFGIPFISYKGPNKAVEFLKSVKLDNFVCDSQMGINEILSSFNGDLGLPLSNSMKNSYNHFNLLNSLIN